MTKQELITKVEAERDRLYAGQDIVNREELYKLTSLLFMLKAEEMTENLNQSLSTIDFSVYTGGVK